MKKKKFKHRFQKYGYNIDEVEAGDNVAVMCDAPGCKHFLRMVVDYPSTMQMHHYKTKEHFDLRNQSWTCYQHRQAN